MKKTVSISINKHRLIYSAVFAVALMFLMLIIFDLFYFPIGNTEEYVNEKYGGYTQCVSIKNSRIFLVDGDTPVTFSGGRILSRFHEEEPHAEDGSGWFNTMYGIVRFDYGGGSITVAGGKGLHITGSYIAGGHLRTFDLYNWHFLNYNQAF